MSNEFFRDSFVDSAKLIDAFLQSSEFAKCENFAKLVVQCIKAEGILYAAGNGGSHCQAMHFAEEFTGRFELNRRPIGAVALGDPSHLSCVGNDFGFEDVYSRQIEGLGRKNDFFLLLSTSGNSENLVRAAESAKKKGLQCFALLGRDGGKLKDVVEDHIIVPHTRSDRIQEIHIKLIHMAIHAAEKELFS